jgi:hypothetical protein
MGVWVEDPKEGTFLVHGSESIMREIFGNIIEKMPAKLVNLSAPEPVVVRHFANNPWSMLRAIRQRL